MPPFTALVSSSSGVLDQGFDIFLVAATTLTPSSQTAAYMRVAAITLAAYDWFITLRPEFRLYQRHKPFSKAVVLFVLVRYVSIAAIVTSNVGFFGTGFSARTCLHYHLVAPLTKMFATLISQVIISIRTYAISRKSRWVLYSLSTLFVLSCVPEVLGNAWQRKAVQNSTYNCTSGNLPEHRVAWVHYLAAVVFDTVAMGIATFYLYNPTRTTISGLAKVMLEEGLFYFIFLTIANVVNLAMFISADISAQSCAAVFGQAVTMIMSQRIILNLQEWTGEPSQGPSRSRSGPDFPMHVLRGETRSNGTPGPKVRDGWSESVHVKSTPDVWNNQKHGQHTRKASSGMFELEDVDSGGVHVVVEREVRYDLDAVSDSEKSVLDGKK
ncbi:unnamed protein product [Rhizoctonia solani]|uniref:DUF6533 domain-containing protein n=1 Tax=Rhizoctonia solani TaxID=456999 RepID=A0A8H2XEW7_9AGAM|nr:unnamed protein product [Rhizoctonia solani]